MHLCFGFFCKFLVRANKGFKKKSSPDVLFILREAPVGNAKLQLLWDGRIDLLYHFKWDVKGDLFC